ncbi:MAG: spore photoproduct lyase family protein [Spirochaetaceae bacterium]
MVENPNSTQHRQNLNNKLARFADDPVFLRLDGETRRFISRKAEELRLSHQDLRCLIEAAADFEMWGLPPVHELWDEGGTEKLTGKVKRRRILDRLLERHAEEKEKGPDYHSFSGGPPPKERLEYSYLREDSKILGTCPVAGEKTRCCNLQTLDAVQQCGFACSYCAIQSFYGDGKVFFFENLEEKLKKLSLELDSRKIYHIGTGQSSDSLMWGNRGGLLDSLAGFARGNPNVILELKSKSALLKPLLDRDLPPNILATWSLNPDEVIHNEEHLTSNLDARIGAARRAADRGMLVGFHFHPVIRFSGWREKYARIYSRLQEEFRPSEVVMVSLGTLTYPKPVVRLIRSQKIRSGVLKMPLENSADKLSYPFDIKRELFSHAYGSFSEKWRQEVFFYLCMEDPQLWEPVFGYSYPTNGKFEEAMKAAYMDKIQSSRKSMNK